MHIKNQKKPKSYIYIWAVSIAVIVLILCAYFFLFRKPSPIIIQPQYAPGTSEDNATDNPDKQQANPMLDTPNEEIPLSATGNVTITNLNQKNGYVNVLAEVSSFTPSQCVYTFTSDGSKPVIREQNGTCVGVSILEDEFDRIGTYRLTVSVYGDNQKLTTSKDIYIK